MTNSVSRSLFSVVSIITFLATLSHAQQTAAIQGQVIMRAAAGKTHVPHPSPGQTQLDTATLDTFLGTMRFPAELSNQFFQPQMGDTIFAIFSPAPRLKIRVWMDNPSARNWSPPTIKR